jgi:hypothetical protein
MQQHEHPEDSAAKTGPSRRQRFMGQPHFSGRRLKRFSNVNSPASALGAAMAGTIWHLT